MVARGGSRRTWPLSRRPIAQPPDPGPSAASSSRRLTRARATGPALCLNDLGWDHFDAGEYEPALDAFERALAGREEAGDEGPLQIARYAMGKTLRMLGRFDEAIARLEPAIALRRPRKARPTAGSTRSSQRRTQAPDDRPMRRSRPRLAIPLLLEADSDFGQDADVRSGRLRLLAGDSRTS